MTRPGSIRIGFWRPRPPSFDTLLGDVFGVLGGKPPIRSFGQTFRAILNGGLPWPADFVDLSWNPAERAAIVAYLKHDAFRGTAYLGYSDCRLCGKDNGDSDFGDGIYLWPEGYAHYVEAHGVRPPPEFLAHVFHRPSPLPPPPWPTTG